MIRWIERKSWVLKNMLKRAKLYLQICLLGVALIVFSTTRPVIAERVTDDELVAKLRSTSSSVQCGNLPVSTILEAIGRSTDVKVSVDQSINDIISLDLQEVNLYDLFMFILDTKDLQYNEVGREVVVKRAAGVQKKQNEIVTVRVCPLYGQVEAYVKELTELKSEDGRLMVSPNGSCLEVKDHIKNVKEVARRLRELDIPPPQIHIRGRIVAIHRSISKELGIRWGYTGMENFPPDNLTGAANISVFDSPESMIFGFIRDSHALNQELKSLQENNQLEILSEPRLVVVNGQVVDIKEGNETTIDSDVAHAKSNSTRVTLAGLEVYPKIIEEKFIRLDIKAIEKTETGIEPGDNQQPVRAHEIRTNLFLEDSGTLVVGNISSTGASEIQEVTPWFAEFPMIGRLLKDIRMPDDDLELLVFLTPSILKSKNGKFIGGQMVDLLRSLENDLVINDAILPGLIKGEGVASPSRLLLHPLELNEK